MKIPNCNYCGKPLVEVIDTIAKAKEEILRRIMAEYIGFDKYKEVEKIINEVLG